VEIGGKLKGFVGDKGKKGENGGICRERYWVF